MSDLENLIYLLGKLQDCGMKFGTADRCTVYQSNRSIAEFLVENGVTVRDAPEKE